MYAGFHVNYLLFLVGFNEILLILTDFRKILKYHISGKSIQWESSCCMYRDGQTHGQTGMTKLLVAFAILRTGFKIQSHATYQTAMVFGNRGTLDREFLEFLGVLAKLRKLTVSFVMAVSPSVRPFVRKGQIGSYQKDFHEILYLSVFRKCVKKIQISIKYDKNDEYITLRHIYMKTEE